MRRLTRVGKQVRGGAALAVIAAYVVATAVGGGDWAVAAGAAGVIALLAGAGAFVVARPTRTLLGEGYDRRDIIDAVSEELEREEALRVYEHGSVTTWLQQHARPVALAGLVVFAAGLGLSFVEPIGPEIGFRVVLGGVGLALVAAIAGHAHARRRPDLLLRLWRRFWESPAGAWVERLAGFRLGAKPLPEPARSVMTRVHAGTRHAVARIEQIRQVLMATPTTEAGEAAAAPAVSSKLRQRLEAKSGELDRAVLRMWQHQPGNDADGLAREVEAVERVCHVVDGILEADGVLDWEWQLRSKK